MPKSTNSQKKPKTVELVHKSYQPTKAEKEEPFKIKAPVEQLADALLRPVKPRWIDKPRSWKR